MRDRPNIIITGTPGVGKSSHCELLAEKTRLRHLSVNDVVKTKECHDGWDDAYHSWIVDEDKLLDAIEDNIKAGGCLIDWHACDLFPKRWIDLVVVLRADTTTLYDRLVKRKYPEAKLQENIDSEIMDVLIEEARSAFDEEIVVELQSTSTEELEANVSRIVTWVERWEKDNAGRADDGSEEEEDDEGSENSSDADDATDDGEDEDEEDEPEDENEPTNDRGGQKSK